MNETTLHAKDCFKLCIVLLYYVLYMTVAGSGAGIDIDATATKQSTQSGIKASTLATL